MGDADSSVDTIVAAATPAGRGGVGVVRISGPLAPDIAAAILGNVPPPRRAVHASFGDEDGALLDTGIALFFPAPHSFTGEHVLELQGHGSPLVQELLVARAVALGARRAGPGEFTQRAFLNGKLDLAQAEAIADLIAAGSEAGARAALRSLRGDFSAQVTLLADALTALRTYVEAAIDFPEEGVDFLGTHELQERGASLRRQFDAVERATVQGSLVTSGITVVIAGRPNAGKSTLMNRLAGYDAAIVTPVAGTTRDPLRERIDLDGLPMLLIDTAGLREPGAAAAADEIEAEGVRRARDLVANADHVLFVVDAVADPHARAFAEERARLPPRLPVTLVMNKQDLLPHAARAAAVADVTNTAGKDESPSPVAQLHVSAATGAGIDALREHLKRSAGFVDASSTTLSARARHVDALRAARVHFDAAVKHVEQRAGELAAEELRLAHDALGEVTGEVSSDELLGRIFASFCIGK